MANVPVLDRTEEKKEYGYRSAVMANEEDLARIRRNYAMLINPNTKLDELLDRPAEKPAANQTDVFRRRENKVYLVENARADSELFRADSAINRRVEETASAEAVDTEEEENEDLRPTPTTIQYRTAGIKNTEVSGKIQNSGAKKHSVLNKRERIIIAVAISVIVALFALVIINSAIISQLNSDINALQGSVNVAKDAYSGASESISRLMLDINNKVAEYVLNNGMIR